MKPRAAFHQWHHRAKTAAFARIYPDGCRDVLIVRGGGRPDRVFLTAFDFRPRAVALVPGTTLTGYRLRPGAVLSGGTVAAIATDPDAAGDILEDALAARDGDDLGEMIHALAAPGKAVKTVARSHGVSPRTLQRRFADYRLPPPDFWRLLGRARYAGGLLATHAPLAEIAAAGGFSDQAHMTREFARWFGGSPAQLRGDSGFLKLLRQPALGNWTGEQISTR
jgi:AraC-like DNA-binding protein